MRHPDEAALEDYLRRTQSAADRASTRQHLDACPQCWARWNLHRWDAARDHPLLDELEHFLGPAFRRYVDSSPALAREWDDLDPQTSDERAQFFRTSTSYLYNLVLWEASGNRPDYVSAALPHLAAHGVRTILDIGSGIGSDAISLGENGYRVACVDYDSPSTRFARWRATSIPAVVEPDDIATYPPTDCLWVIDTLDHIQDLDGSLGAHLSRADLVIMEKISEERRHGRQRFHHRRSETEIRAHFDTYGLVPIPAASTITVFARKRAPAHIDPPDQDLPDPDSQDQPTGPL